MATESSRYADLSVNMAGFRKRASESIPEDSSSEAVLRTGTCREFTEESILKKREERKRKKFSSIETGMYIMGKVERFAPARLFDEKMEIMVPESFCVAPEAYRQVKYPSQYRPEILLTSEDFTANMGFNYFNQQSIPEELEALAFQTKNMLKRADVSIQFYSHQITDTNHCRKVWFDFRTQAMDEAMYNIHFLTLIDEHIVQGIFNCLYRNLSEWGGATSQMISSVKDLSI